MTAHSCMEPTQQINAVPADTSRPAARNNASSALAPGAASLTCCGFTEETAHAASHHRDVRRTAAYCARGAGGAAAGNPAAVARPECRAAARGVADTATRKGLIGRSRNGDRYGLVPAVHSPASPPGRDLM